MNCFSLSNSDFESSSYESLSSEANSETEFEDTITSTRLRVCKKILKSERDYANSLDILVRQFQNQLEKKNSNQNQIVRSPQIKAIFSNSKKLLSSSVELIHTMEYKLLVWNNDIEIGDSFISQKSNIKLYSQYFSQYENALYELAKCEKNKPFSEFYKSQERKFSTNLRDLLKTPILEAFIKKDLISELFQCTKSKHKDHKILSQYLNFLEELVGTIQNKKQQKLNQIENKQQSILENIQKRFVGKVV
ncbi:hypothetical protein M0813_00685 [Anaeramoeba flamelloides]|uniref:DH domain-containing protein n=1 Tax=Anaeramoeba flamelloides TaxID=1746091 RepID=A0ABQ8XN60_9EUKA|nr:hypothetical protein M0813_00685 [Anaeramoeba flamelloides]